MIFVIKFYKLFIFNSLLREPSPLIGSDVLCLPISVFYCSSYKNRAVGPCLSIQPPLCTTLLSRPGTFFASYRQGSHLSYRYPNCWISKSREAILYRTYNTISLCKATRPDKIFVPSLTGCERYAIARL